MADFDDAEYKVGAEYEEGGQQGWVHGEGGQQGWGAGGGQAAWVP